MAGSSADIRRQVVALLDGTITLEQFQRWFASAAMTIELHGNDAEVDLSNRVLNLLAEYTGDHISESDVLRVLRDEMIFSRPDTVSAVA